MARDAGIPLKWVGFTLTSLSTLLVALRLYVRQVQVRKAGWSDYIMVVALLCTWAVTVVNYFQTTFGKKHWELQLAGADPFSSKYQAALSGTLVTWFICRPLYIITLSLVKLSILAFYQTLVPPSASVRYLRPFRWTVTGLLVFTTLYAISMLLASILQCDPPGDAYSVVAYLSQTYPHLPKPRCFQPQILWAFSAIVNFATDILILLLPLPIVLSLRSMSRGKKFGAFMISSLGMSSTIASAVRMYILVMWYKDVHTQEKWGTDLLIWGQVEVNCGILGACAPFMRPLFRRYIEKRASKTGQSGLSPRARGEAIRMESCDVSFADSQTIISGVHPMRDIA